MMTQLCYEAGSRLADCPASGRLRLRLRSPLQSCWLHATPRRPAPRVARGPDTHRPPRSPPLSARPPRRPHPPAGPWTAVRVTRHHGPSNVCAAARQHVVVKLNAARPVVLVRVRAGRQVCTRHGGADVCLLLAYHACMRRLRVEGPNKLGRQSYTGPWAGSGAVLLNSDVSVWPPAMPGPVRGRPLRAYVHSVLPRVVDEFPSSVHGNGTALDTCFLCLSMPR